MMLVPRRHGTISFPLPFSSSVSDPSPGFLYLYLDLSRIHSHVRMPQGHGVVVANPTYESNIPFVLRFMIDYKLVGGNWVELKRV